MKQFKLEEEIEKTLLSPLSGQIIHINHNVGDKVKKKSRFNYISCYENAKLY